MATTKNNTGDRNTGDRNTGYYNAGYGNTGDRNTGDYNTGDRNTGHYNAGDCNETTPTVRLFDKDSGWRFLGPEHTRFRQILTELSLPLCEWVSEANMSYGEKIKFSTCKTAGGYLKVNKNISSSKEMSKEDREFLLSVPNFNAGILKRTTGIDIDNEKVKIIIDGREVWTSKESAENVKKALIG